MVRANRRILSMGGAVILLLPIILHSYTTQGISFAYNLTDNINQYNMSGAGQIAGLRPYFFLEDVVNFDYEGDFSLINFDPYNLLMANSIGLSKIALLHGIGNKTIFYANLYSFHAPNYSLYRVADIVAGDSGRVYFGNHLLMWDARARYKYFLSDSAADYLEPRLETGLAMPLPYAVLTPMISAGFRAYGDEITPFYSAAVQIYFPLSLDFSMSSQFTFRQIAAPDNAYITSIRYADDPFFEEENLSTRYDLDLSAYKSLLKERAFIEARAGLFRKIFYAMDGLGRRDEGIRITLQYTKFMSREFVFHTKIGTILNSSTVNDFDFMKNDLELIFELIF